MECQFVVGQKVVCVDDDPTSHQLQGYYYAGNLNGLTRGEIYTIREVYVEPEFGWVVVCLEEIIREIEMATGCEAPYHANRFRPVQTKKTDISAFHEILRKVNDESLVNA